MTAPLRAGLGPVHRRRTGTRPATIVAPSPPEPHPGFLVPGTRLEDRYIVGELVGRGGMADVYRGRHEGTGAWVAIKVLSLDYRHDPFVQARFIREARTTSKVRHENVIELTDCGTIDDLRPFIIMEYLEGEDLGTTLAREGPLPWSRARPMLVQLLAAVQAAHDRGIVHRDLKPENLFRTRKMGSDDFVTLFDFGIAKVHEPDDQALLTLDGQVFGTPSYMSPEQCQGLVVDHRSDLYSVGIIAYRMLTGVMPFSAEAPERLMIEHCERMVPCMAFAAPRVVVPPRVEALVRRALAKKADDRFATAEEFARAMLADVAPGSRGLFEDLGALFR